MKTMLKNLSRYGLTMQRSMGRCVAAPICSGKNCLRGGWGRFCGTITVELHQYRARALDRSSWAAWQFAAGRQATGGASVSLAIAVFPLQLVAAAHYGGKFAGTH